MALIAPIAADRVLESLIEGNLRFRRGAPRLVRHAADRRRSLLRGQSPSAIVLSCSDSRVPPELVFDQGLGDLFVIRTAGHILDVAAIASIDYAVIHLETPLLLVLAHSGCGAVSMALFGGASTPAERAVAEAIAPAIVTVSQDPDHPGALVDHVARAHALRTAAALPALSDTIAARIAAGRLVIRAAFYDLASGAVAALASA